MEETPQKENAPQNGERNISSAGGEYGAVLGIGLVIYSLLLYLLGLRESGFSQGILWALVIGGLFAFTKQFRDKERNGTLRYKEGLGLCALIILVLAICLAVYNYVLLAFIDPGILEKGMEMARRSMEERGLSEERIEEGMRWARKFSGPGFASVGVFFSTFFLGFIFALIVPAFLQKDSGNGSGF